MPISINVVSSNPVHGEVHSIQYYVIKFVSDLQHVRVVFSGYSGYLHQWNWLPRYNWNIVESGVKHHTIELFIPCLRKAYCHNLPI